MRPLRPVRATYGFCAATSLLVLTACSSGRGTTDPPTPSTAVARVQVNVDTVRLKIGRTAQLTARAVDASGTVLTDVPITYGVRSTAVASVSPSGMVGAARLGTTSLHVSAGAAAADVPVVVSFDSASYTRRPLSGGPFGVALGGDVLVVTQKDAGAVAVGSLSDAPLRGGIAVGAVPTDISVNAAGTEAYVTNQYGGTLGIVNVGTRQQVAAVALPYGPYRSVLSRDEQRVWVTTNAGRIYAVARRVVDSLVGAGPTNGFAIAPGDTEVFDLAGAAATPATAIRLGVGQVFGMALGPDGNTLFVARTLDGAVAAIDRTSRKTVFSHPIGGLPRRVKFAASGTAIVVANEAGWVDVLR